LFFIWRKYIFFDKIVELFKIFRIFQAIVSIVHFFNSFSEFHQREDVASRGLHLMETMSLPSYAKINLGLLLLQKREDGYHDIATIFQEIDLHDTIIFRKVPSSIHITSTNPNLPLDGDNLVYRAFRLFQEKVGIREGLKIHIDKHIPIGGGLGGGSSNAAATLVAANRLWERNLSHSELQTMAIEIGSDVPFFLMGGTALGRGRGEILTPLTWKTDCWVLLVCPMITVSTSWVYKHSKIALTKEEKFTKFGTIFEKCTPHALRENAVNDLESVVFRRHPILREVKELLYKRDAFYASMSGSGSSVFGLFFHKEQAEAAKTFFSIERGMTTFLCKPISSRLQNEVS